MMTVHVQKNELGLNERMKESAVCNQSEMSA